MKLCRSCLLVSLLMAMTAYASGGEPVKLFLEDDGSKGEVHPLTLEDMKIHPMEGFLYNENYFLIAITDSGYYGYVNILVSNSGLKHMQPGISFTIVTPESQRLVRDRDFQPQDLEASQDHFELRIKHNSFKKTDQGYYLEVSQDGLGMELQYKNRVPGLVLGNGKAVFGREGRHFFYINYPAPRPEVEGWFTVNGEEVPVSGWGYIDHSISATNPAAFEDVWHNMKFHSDTHTVLISSFTTPEPYQENFGHAVITDHKEVLCAFTDVRVIEEDVEVDPESGKPYPKKVHYRLVGDDCSASATMDCSKLTEKFDVLKKLEQKWYTKAVKLAINTFIAEPWFFRSVAPTAVHMEVQGREMTVHGQAFNEIIYTE